MGVRIRRRAGRPRSRWARPRWEAGGGRPHPGETAQTVSGEHPHPASVLGQEHVDQDGEEVCGGLQSGDAPGMAAVGWRQAERVDRLRGAPGTSDPSAEIGQEEAFGHAVPRRRPRIGVPARPIRRAAPVSTMRLQRDRSLRDGVGENLRMASAAPGPGLRRRKRKLDRPAARVLAVRVMFRFRVAALGPAVARVVDAHDVEHVHHVHSERHSPARPDGQAFGRGPVGGAPQRRRHPRPGVLCGGLRHYGERSRW